jgi:hypothetical protein
MYSIKFREINQMGQADAERKKLAGANAIQLQIWGKQMLSE